MKKRAIVELLGLALMMAVPLAGQQTLQQDRPPTRTENASLPFSFVVR